MIRRWMLGAALFATLSCAKSHQLTDTSTTVFGLASSNPHVGTFITMLQRSDVATALQGSEEVTVLAPSNVAITTLGEERVRFLMSDEGADELLPFVNAHIFPGSFSAEDVARGKLPRSVAGERIAASKAEDGTPRVEGTGKIVESMKGSNGYVHVIDTVLR